LELKACSAGFRSSFSKGIVCFVTNFILEGYTVFIPVNTWKLQNRLLLPIANPYSIQGKRKKKKKTIHLS